MTTIYGFTDYRSQGQSLICVIVDIAKPPTGKMNLFSFYVVLSRRSGRETIRLPRGFDDEMFRKGHDPEFPAEDDLLEG
ncbi:uncharacterized protein EV420DRAFT_643136 [Desarmillaria tabescens]|uniref:Uncharacterized protein n=1 Tax=Armillaria tabescens TaxID=1929756 RepID=A0AA39NJF4_ARMTA|nr:uncharacterized protein EV420DRAFT_643136 [Desarmillaria tabescens]KAK0466715.1 hypothetical protein EV420DRAFT_643136 [Desarmillaria tabescens]